MVPCTDLSSRKHLLHALRLADHFSESIIYNLYKINRIPEIYNLSEGDAYPAMLDIKVKKFLNGFRSTVRFPRRDQTEQTGAEALSLQATN